MRGIQVKDLGRAGRGMGAVPSGARMAGAVRRRPAMWPLRSLLGGCALLAVAMPAHRAEAASTYRCAAYGYAIAVPAGWYHARRDGSDCRVAASGSSSPAYGVAPSSPNFHTVGRQAEFEVVIDPAGRASLATWTQALLSGTRVEATATAPARMGAVAAEASRSTVVLHSARGGSQRVLVLCIGTMRAGRFYGVEAFVTQDNNPAAASQESAIAAAVAGMELP